MNQSDHLTKEYLVNVVLVTYNPNLDDLFKNIQQFIDGVASVILVDNASTIDIQSKLNDYCLRNDKVTYLSMQTNNGIGAAQNEAIRFILSQKMMKVNFFYSLIKTVI